jgi:hypothetical protein
MRNNQMRLKNALMLSGGSLFTAILMVTSVRVASAEPWCAYCDPHIQCWVAQSDGYYNCTNVGNGCLLSDPCAITFASDYSPDGTRIVAALSFAAQADRSVINSQMTLVSLAELVSESTYTRRKCDNSIIARAYSVGQARVLRETSRSIVI